MDLFPQLLGGRFESLHLLSDARTGLRAFVAIHSTRRGPALGGARALTSYAGEGEALTDALRLARAMTYKAALAEVPHGGGKAVLMLPPVPFDRGALFEAFGRGVEALGGRYITAEDSGTTPEDMAHVRRATRYVAGLEGEGGTPLR